MVFKQICFSLIVVFVFQSCNQNIDRQAVDSALEHDKQEQFIDTIQNKLPNIADQSLEYKYEIYKNEAPLNGFGYCIFINNKKTFNSPTVPAIQGNKPFVTKLDAKKIAELSIYKLKNNIMPPTIYIKELDSLQIKY